MYQVSQITTNARQQQTLILYDGSQLNIEMYFSLLQQGWFFTSLTWNTFTLEGLRITNSPNMLYQWKNILTFGLACFSTDDREPSLIQDFSSGNSILYILNATEVLYYSELLSGQV